MAGVHETNAYAGADVQQYMRVPLGSLRLDEVTGFDLYLQSEGGRPPVLYRAAELAFTEEARERLTQSRIEYLLVHRRHRDAYKRYLERNLGALVADATVPVEQRSATLYFSAKEVLKDLFEDPRSGDMIERSGAMVEHTVSLLYNESHALRHLMRVASYDYYTYTHSVNVFAFSTALMKRLGFPREVVTEFGQGALLHDIGKSEVDPEIVNCRGRLSDEQFAQMKRHTVHGWEILRAQGVTSALQLGVTRHHHEKLDGTGYPDGLRGGEIPIPVRAATIADIFDALTTRRSYKDAMNSFPSLKLMREEMRNEIDLEIFREFVELLSNP